MIDSKCTSVSVCAEEPATFTLQCNTRTCFGCVCSQSLIVVHALKIWSRSGARSSTQPVSRTWQTHTHIYTLHLANAFNQSVQNQNNKSRVLIKCLLVHHITTKIRTWKCHRYLVVHVCEGLGFLWEVDELKERGHIIFMIFWERNWTNCRTCMWFISSSVCSGSPCSDVRAWTATGKWSPAGSAGRSSLDIQGGRLWWWCVPWCKSDRFSAVLPWLISVMWSAYTEWHAECVRMKVMDMFGEVRIPSLDQQRFAVCFSEVFVKSARVPSRPNVFCVHR